MRERSSRGVRVFSVDAERVLDEVERVVASRYGTDPNVVGVVLFGSFARGDAVPGSDVDLLVVLARDDRPAHRRILDHIPDGISVGTDVVPWTLAELGDRLARGDRFARVILGEGRVLLDRDGAIARLA